MPRWGLTLRLRRLYWSAHSPPGKGSALSLRSTKSISTLRTNSPAGETAWGAQSGLTIKIRHYPPGTSKWNRIEHRLFCRITQNWRGRQLTDHAAIIEFIGATSTRTGLKIETELDTRVYEKGIKIINAEMKRLDIRADAFHPEWNYSVVPRKAKS